MNAFPGVTPWQTFQAEVGTLLPSLDNGEEHRNEVFRENQSMPLWTELNAALRQEHAPL